MDEDIKTKSSNTETPNIIFLLDETGSMLNKLSDTIGGFNSFVKEQKELGQPFKFWLTLFNSSKIEKRYIGIDISKVEDLSEENYRPNNYTPLYDAIGKTIIELNGLSNALFVIMTDGEENSSREFTAQSIRRLIAQKESEGFKFLYLGVDIQDYKEQALTMGFLNSYGVSGLTKSMKSFSKTVSSYNKSVVDKSVNMYNVVEEFSKEYESPDEKK